MQNRRRRNNAFGIHRVMASLDRSESSDGIGMPVQATAYRRQLRRMHGASIIVDTLLSCFRGQCFKSHAFCSRRSRRGRLHCKIDR